MKAKRGLPSKACIQYFDGGVIQKGLKFFMGIFAPLFWSNPENPSDLLVEGKAELICDSKNRLAEISVPTLVIGGDRGYYFPVELLQGTAAGIANDLLVLYEGKGHMLSRKQFDDDVLEFLNE